MSDDDDYDNELILGSAVDMIDLDCHPLSFCEMTFDSIVGNLIHYLEWLPETPDRTATLYAITRALRQFNRVMNDHLKGRFDLAAAKAKLAEEAAEDKRYCAELARQATEMQERHGEAQRARN